MQTNWQTKNSSIVYKLIQSILRKYIKLNLNNSVLFKQLKNNLQNQAWIDNTEKTLSKVKNSEHIFYITKEITKDKNDQRVREMCAEFDVAKRLVDVNFFETFTNVEYLIKSKTTRKPDFLAYENNNPVPVEVKFLTPQGLDKEKFFQKLIDKINNHALKQLQSFYKNKQFSKSMIFIWTDKPVPLVDIEYTDLKRYFKKKVKKQKFKVTVICILSNSGLWDFHL